MVQNHGVRGFGRVLDFLPFGGFFQSNLPRPFFIRLEWGEEFRNNGPSITFLLLARPITVGSVTLASSLD